MRSEIASTARPTALRLVGFLCLAAGAIAAGAGATREWATIGFADDPEGALEVPINGTDVWDGKVVLFAAVAALLGLLAMRLSTSGARRRALATLLIALGLACAVLPTLVALRAEDRFGGAGAVDRMAESLAADADLPEDVVREQLAEEFRRSLRVGVEPWPWVAAGGGVLLMAGGVLGIAWARQRAAVSADAPNVEPPEPGSEP